MFDWDYFNHELEWVIEIPSGKKIEEIGVIESVEVNEKNRRVYVKLKKHRMNQFFEERIRDIIQNMGYDPEVELED